MKLLITVERLRELLAYNPKTGVFTRRVRTSTRTQIGDVAGSIDGNGYRLIRINGRKYGAQRLAWLYVNGTWPQHQIDHINGDRADNRIANLRDVPQSVNMQNQRHAQRSNKSSGLLGVTAEGSRWRAHIWVCGRQWHLGRFATPEEAHTAYLAAKREHHLGCTL